MYSVFKSAAYESSISPSPYCMCVMVEHIVSDMTMEIVTNFSLASIDIKKKKNIKILYEYIYTLIHCYIVEYCSPKYGIDRKSLYALKIKQTKYTIYTITKMPTHDLMF
jgi:hypothetical protein